MIAFSREKNQRMRKIFTTNLANFVKVFGGSFLRGVFIGLLLLILGGYGAFRIAYYQKVFPGVFVSKIDVSGMTINESLYQIDSLVNNYLEENEFLTLSHGNDEWTIKLSDLGIKVDTNKMKNELLGIGKSGSLMKQAQDQYRLLFVEKTSIPVNLILNETLLSEFVATAAALIDNPAIPPRVYIGQEYNQKTNSLVVVENGTQGEVVSQKDTLDMVIKNLRWMHSPNISLVTKNSEVEASDEQLQLAEENAKTLYKNSLVLFFNDETSRNIQTWNLEGKDLVSFLSVVEKYDTKKINDYLISVKKSVDRPAENALFQFEKDTNKVIAFKPAKKGIEIQTDSLQMQIQEALDSLLENKKVADIEVDVVETDPKVDTAAVNDLGIETLLGKGESTYYHSIASRKYNVELAASKLNGVLIPPGEEFSFNKYLGEVSAQTGFQQAYIIRDGRTLLGDGGGVCQDSTTLFRAVLDAGLPITSWQNHSYRVGYYEQNYKPGFDATVYSPLPDFKFTNNTPGHILIQTKAVDMALTYELYGTDDGRVSEISNYTQWDSTPPPPDLHQDDPSLPMGVVKKVESSVPGLKTKFDYVVKRGDEVLFKKTFLSVFKPWQAVYLHGTAQ